MSAGRLLAACVVLTAALTTASVAADYPAPRQGDFMAHDFKFHTGEVMLYLIPASDETRGHATTGMAKFYAEQLRAFLAAAPSRGM